MFKLYPNGILYNGDAAIVMQSFENESIDLTITSPPYDDLRQYKGYSFDYKAIADQLFRITKKGGVVVWVIGDKTKDGSETGSSFEQALYFKSIGFNLHDTMIWKKTNPMPKMKTKRYFDCFEFMFVFSKGQPKTFNPIMVDCKFGGQIYDSTVKVVSKDKVRKNKIFVLNQQRYKDNIWEIAVAQNKTTHSAVFPKKLVNDHIITWTNVNDVVLDCMAGSGTTALVCDELQRQFVLIEIAEEYCNLIDEQLNGK